ncbi:hypothetical protein CLF_103850, partial [Clonorchis sinensis]
KLTISHQLVTKRLQVTCQVRQTDQQPRDQLSVMTRSGTSSLWVCSVSSLVSVLLNYVISSQAAKSRYQSYRNSSEKLTRRKQLSAVRGLDGQYSTTGHRRVKRNVNLMAAHKKKTRGKTGPLMSTKCKHFVTASEPSTVWFNDCDESRAHRASRLTDLKDLDNFCLALSLPGIISAPYVLRVAWQLGTESVLQLDDWSLETRQKRGVVARLIILQYLSVIHRLWKLVVGHVDRSSKMLSERPPGESNPKRVCSQSFRVYTNFRGGANYLEYAYTYEDCIANMKQRFIRDECRCYSDNLFVPFEGADRQLKPGKHEGRGNIKAFCRDIRQKTSQRLRGDFLCYDQYENMPTTSVLDKFVPLDKLYDTREDLDTRKIERHKICDLLCRKDIYSTRFFEVLELDPNLTFSPALLDSYVKQLSASQLDQPILQEFMEKYEGMDKVDSSVHLEELKTSDLIIVDIRLTKELIDVWEEELTESLFNLISNLGGTLGLCAGISFLSSFFLFCFFGRAFFHALMSFVLWFWWSVYLGRPPPTSLATDPTLGFVQSSVGDLSNPNDPDHPSKDLGSASSLVLSSVSLWTSGLSKGKHDMQATSHKPKQDDLTTGDQMETSSEEKPESSTLSNVPPIQRTMAVLELSQRNSPPEKKSGRQIFPSRIMVTQPDESAVHRQQEDKADHEKKWIPSQSSAPEPPVVTVRHHRDRQTDRLSCLTVSNPKFSVTSTCEICGTRLGYAYTRQMKTDKVGKDVLETSNEGTPVFPRADGSQPFVNAAHRHEKGQADQVNVIMRVLSVLLFYVISKKSYYKRFQRKEKCHERQRTPQPLTCLTESYNHVLWSQTELDVPGNCSFGQLLPFMSLDNKRGSNFVWNGDISSVFVGIRVTQLQDHEFDGAITGRRLSAETTDSDDDDEEELQDHEFDGAITGRRLSAETTDSDDDDEEETTSSETESQMEDSRFVPEQSNLRAVDSEDYETVSNTGLDYFNLYRRFFARILWKVLLSIKQQALNELVKFIDGKYFNIHCNAKHFRTSHESQNDFLVRDDFLPSTPIRDWVLRGSDREHNPDLIRCLLIDPMFSQVIKGIAHWIKTQAVPLPPLPLQREVAPSHSTSEVRSIDIQRPCKRSAFSKHIAVVSEKPKPMVNESSLNGILGASSLMYSHIYDEDDTFRSSKSKKPLLRTRVVRTGEFTEPNERLQEKDLAFQNKKNPAHRPRRLPENIEPQKLSDESELPRLRDFLYRQDSDDFPPFIYDPPPPPLVRRPLDGATGRRIYMPEERNFDLPPLLDQELIPEYLRARYYGDPPPYSAQWYYK